MYQNRVHLIGYLGKNPEQKSAKESDRKYTVFSLATKRAWKGALTGFPAVIPSRPRNPIIALRLRRSNGSAANNLLKINVLGRGARPFPLPPPNLLWLFHPVSCMMGLRLLLLYIL